MIFSNQGGTLKVLDKISVQPSSGTIKTLSAVHANVGGTLKKLHPNVTPPYMFQITHTAGGGSPSNMGSTTTHSSWQTAQIGYRYQYANTVAATGSSGTPIVSFISQSATFYPKESCKLKISVLNHATVKINDVEKAVGTYSVSTSDKIYFSFSISATSSTSTKVSVSGEIDFELTS